MPDRTCVFCHAPITKATASREDTVPKWLQSYLGIATSSVEPTLTTPSGEQLAQRVHPVDQLLTGRVCKECNNGWMSDLENAAKPVIADLISGEGRLQALVRADRQVLSRWAVKTAFMLDAGGLEPRVSQLQVEQLFAADSHVPPNVQVFGYQHKSNRPWYYVSGAWWNHAPLDQTAKIKVERDSYKIALQFGDLILVVVYWPLRRWHLRVEREHLMLVWPPTDVVKLYDHPQPPETESDAICRRLLVTVSVVPLAGAEGYAAN